jgi:hypothetical protein
VTARDIKLVASGDSVLPTLRPLEALRHSLKAADIALTQLEKAIGLARYGGLDPLALRSAMAKVVALGIKDISERTDEARRSATVEKIAEHLAKLFASYPTQNRDKAAASIMFDRVAAKRPTIGGLDHAICWLLDTSKFLPAISEVLEALGEKEDLQNRRSQRVAEAPLVLGHARRILNYLERPPEQIDEEKRICHDWEVEKCAALIKSGSDAYGEAGHDVVVREWIDSRPDTGGCWHYQSHHVSAAVFESAKQQLVHAGWELVRHGYDETIEARERYRLGKRFFFKEPDREVSATDAEQGAE